MREEITAQSIANDIKMSLKAGQKKTYILVEGTSDFLIFKNFFYEVCEFKICFERDRAIDVIANIEQYGFDDVICIIDRDFYDFGEDLKYKSDKIFLTDTHDIETMMLQSLALDKLLDQYASREKLCSLHNPVLYQIFNSCKFIGYLRWYSKMNKLYLDFDLIEFRKYLDKGTLEIDKIKLVNMLLCNSSKKDSDLKARLNSINRVTLVNEVEELCNKYDVDPWFICCGHDVVKILSVGLCKKFGSLSSSDTDMYGIEGLKIERNLSLAYELYYFSETQLYKNICTYEEDKKIKEIIYKLRIA